MAARGFIGAGDVWINPKDPTTGAYLGWVGPLEAAKFSIKPNATRKDLKSKSRDNYGANIATVTLADPPDFAVTLREPTAANLALLFAGVIVATSVTGSAITDEPVTFKATGGATLAKGNITTAAITLTANAGATPGTTYVEGTDFTVNRRLGMLTVISGSSLATAVAAAPATTGLSLYADYMTSTRTSQKIRGGVQPELRAWFRFDGKNLVGGAAVAAEVWEGVLSPSAEFDFLADDWASIDLNGSMSIPTGKTEAFTAEFADA